MADVYYTLLFVCLDCRDFHWYYVKGGVVLIPWGVLLMIRKPDKRARLSAASVLFSHYTTAGLVRVRAGHLCVLRGKHTYLTCVTHIVVAQHDSFGLACGSWGVDERAALVGLLAGDDVIELSVRLVASKLHELCPLRDTEIITYRMLQPFFFPNSVSSNFGRVLTVYRFGLFSFSASLYWTMAFKCGSLSSTCEQQQQHTSTGRDVSVLHNHL